MSSLRRPESLRLFVMMIYIPRREMVAFYVLETSFMRPEMDYSTERLRVVEHEQLRVLSEPTYSSDTQIRV